jgi:hypothetical protein
MTRLYISGQMAGYPEHNRQAFHDAEKLLRDAGFDTLNPVNNGLGPGLPDIDYMRADIKMEMDADGVAVLPGWEASWGAGIEVDLAHRLGIRVLPLALWLPS